MTSLAGRDAELAVLAERVRQARSGEGSVLLLQGDAGIGKSSLLAVACAAAEAAGLRVLSAAAVPADAQRPFAVLRALLRAGGEVPSGLIESTLPAPEAASSGAPAPYAVEEALIDHLDALATRRPLLVVVDDLQWVDESSCAVLHAWARRVAGRQVLVAMAGRFPEPGGGYERLVVGLVRDGATTLRVGPLGPSSVAELAHSRFGAPPGSGLRELLGRAGGNPFYVQALLDHFETAGGVTVDGGHADAADPGMTPSLRDAVLASVASSAAGSRDVLRLAAVLGARFTLSELASVTRLDPVEAWARLDAAVHAGLVDDGGDHLRFRHDLVREAVYAEISGSLRAELHRGVAEALAAQGADPTVVAGHLMAGPRRPDPWAVAWLRRASASVSSLAPATASRFLQRALDLCPAGARERDQMTADLVLNQVWSAQLAEGRRLAAALVRSDVDPDTRATVLLALGWAHWIGGRTVEAVQIFRGGVEDETLSQLRRARLAAIGSWVTGFQLGRLDEARALADHALDLAEPDHDDMATAFAVATHAGVTLLSGRPIAAVTGAEQACAIAARSDSLELRQVGTDILMTLTLIDADRVDDADAAISRGTEISRQSGSASIAAIWHRTRAVRDFSVGEWDDALAELTALRALAEETGRQLGSMAGEAIRAIIAVHRGELDEAGDALSRAQARDSGPEFRGDWVAWARALHLEASGDVAGAFDALEAMWSARERGGLLLDLPRIAPDLVRLASGVDGATVVRVASVLDGLAADAPPTFVAAARRVAGLRERDPDLLVAAADLYRPGRRRFEEAAALVEAGAVLVDRDRATEATALLERAIPLLHELRATACLDRATALLERAGGNSAPPPRRARPTQGWASLTPSELRVAELIAEGLSNPEIAARLFVSRRTVESHVARVLMKLQLRSRTQVVKLVLEGRGMRS